MKKLPAPTKDNKPSLKELEKAFNNDLDLVLFFLSWVKNGRNATKAYLELNPHVDPASAGVLGSRQLKKVSVTAVLETYGVGLDEYINQLKEGHKATKWNDFTGEREPDHKVRGEYNKRLGSLLGIENNTKNQVNVQVNNIKPTFQVMSEEARGLLEKLYERPDGSNN